MLGSVSFSGGLGILLLPLVCPVLYLLLLLVVLIVLASPSGKSGLLPGVKDIDFRPLLTLAVLRLAPPPRKLFLLFRVGVEPNLEDPMLMESLPNAEDEEDDGKSSSMQIDDLDADAPRPAVDAVAVATVLASVSTVLASSTSPPPPPFCCMSLCLLFIRNRSTAVVPSPAPGGRGRDDKFVSIRVRFVGVKFRLPSTRGGLECCSLSLSLAL